MLALRLGLGLVMEEIRPFSKELGLEPILDKWQLLGLDLALMPIGAAKRRLRVRGPDEGCRCHEGSVV